MPNQADPISKPLRDSVCGDSEAFWDIASVLDVDAESLDAMSAEALAALRQQMRKEKQLLRNMHAVLVASACPTSPLGAPVVTKVLLVQSSERRRAARRKFVRVALAVRAVQKAWRLHSEQTRRELGDALAPEQNVEDLRRALLAERLRSIQLEAKMTRVVGLSALVGGGSYNNWSTLAARFKPWVSEVEAKAEGAAALVLVGPDPLPLAFGDLVSAQHFFRNIDLSALAKADRRAVLVKPKKPSVIQGVVRQWTELAFRGRATHVDNEHFRGVLGKLLPTATSCCSPNDL
jgi:hypothetical protein